MNHFYIHGFGTDCIYSTSVRSLNIRVFCLTRDCDDDGLREIFIWKVSSDFSSRVTAVHDWHVVVHKDEMVIALLKIVFFDVLNDGFESNQAVHGWISNEIDVFNLENAFKNALSCLYIKNFIVDEQNLFDVNRR